MALLGNAYWASIEVKEFNVDEFIENVYQEFAGTEHEESREELKSLWAKVLSVTNPRGDASLYPNNNGKHRAAAMKVWHKAGDFWRAKYRQGDQLLCDQHGIALTKNDLASIAKAKAGSGAENGHEAQGDATEEPVEVAVPAVPSRSREGIKEAAPATPKPEPRPEPQQLDLFMMSHQPSSFFLHFRNPLITSPISPRGMISPVCHSTISRMLMPSMAPITVSTFFVALGSGTGCSMAIDPPPTPPC